MEIFWRLLLAHLLADFTLQTNFIAKWKRESVLGGITHSFIFLVCGAALCSGQLGSPWLTLAGIGINGWIALALLSFFHFLEDEWRVWTIKKFNRADSFFFFMLDQFVHVALIFIFFPARSAAPPEKWVLLAALFVLTTHFTSIFVYFTEKAVAGFSKFDDKERYYSMAERLAVGIALLLPGYWAFSFVAAWLPRIFIRRVNQEYETSLMNVIVGNLLAVMFGLAGRAVYYNL